LASALPFLAIEQFSVLAVCKNSVSNPTVTNCAFIENSAGYYGGGMFNACERWAYAFLRRLQDDPTWPPWIPVKDDGK
jgi:hypothetical protein